MFKNCVFLILVMPIACFGACWTDVYSDEQTDIYVDYCTIVNEGKYKKAWERWVYAENQHTEESKAYDETKNLTYYDCALRKSTTVDVVYYSPEPENKVINRATFKFKTSDLSNIVPGTLGEKVFDTVCKAKGKK